MGRRRKNARKLALPLLMGGAAFLIAGEVARRAYRNTQLFAPSREPVKSWDPRDYGIPESAVEELWFETEDGAKLYGWYCRAKRPVASALFCHGNTGNLTVSADIIPHLLDAGLSVLFFDYRGFGKSSGHASIDGVVSDGLTAARFHDYIRPHDRPSILYGYSLGGAVAAQVIRRHRFDGLILQSTFTSLTAITRALYRRLPMHWLAGNFFDTLAVIRSLSVPLLILHGDADETIPHSMARELHDACTARKQLHLVEGGMHKDLYIRDGDALVWAVNQFATEIGQHSVRHKTP